MNEEIELTVAESVLMVNSLLLLATLVFLPFVL